MVIFGIGTTKYEKLEYSFRAKTENASFPAEAMGRILNADSYFLMGSLSLLNSSQIENSGKLMSVLESSFKEELPEISHGLTVSLGPNNMDILNDKESKPLKFLSKDQSFYVYSFFRLYEHFTSKIAEHKEIDKIDVYCDISTGPNAQAYTIAQVTKDVLGIVHIETQKKITIHIVNSDPFVHGIKKSEIREIEVVNFDPQNGNYLQTISYILTYLEQNEEPAFYNLGIKILDNIDTKSIYPYRTLKTLSRGLNSGMIFPICYFQNELRSAFNEPSNNIRKKMSEIKIKAQIVDEHEEIGISDEFQSFSRVITHIFILIRILTSQLFSVPIKDNFVELICVKEMYKKLGDNVAGVLFLKNEIDLIMKDKNEKPEEDSSSAQKESNRDFYAHAGLAKNLIEIKDGMIGYKKGVDFKDILQTMKL